jgi:hypothetical protein
VEAALVIMGLAVAIVLIMFIVQFVREDK